jgi:hypothetical protein
MRISKLEKGKLGTVATIEAPWNKIVDRLTTRIDTPNDIADWDELTKKQQTNLKDVGSFVGGYFSGTKRVAKDIMARSLLTLDLDDTKATIEEFEGLMDMEGVSAVIYSTHQNTLESMRLRLVIPLNREVTPDEYVVIAQNYAEYLIKELPEIGSFDISSYQASRLMFFSSTPIGGVHYAIECQGEELVADDFTGDIVYSSIMPDKTQITVTEKALTPVEEEGFEEMDFEDGLDELVMAGDTPEDTVLEWLNKLDNNVPNDTWVMIGQALHSWNPVRGLDLWEEWSLGGNTYEAGQCETRWGSFTSDGGVSLGTINYLAREADLDSEYEIVHNLVKKVNCANEKQLELSIFKDIRTAHIDDIARERLVTTVQDRLKALTGARPPIKAIREKLKRVTLVGELTEDVPKPKWCGRWVYSSADSAYVYIPNRGAVGSQFKTEAFNLACGKFVPMTGEGDSKQAANRFVSDNGFIEVVGSTQYLPYSEKTILSDKRMGGDVLNTFRPESLPLVSEKLTETGLDAITLVLRHLKLLAGDDERQGEILIAWVAHNAQFMGRKILWAPLIHSVEGVGKGWLFGLLGALIGKQNVGTVKPDQVSSTFNGWAVGSAVTILNELKITGHNRHDVANALKEIITDDVIMVNIKNKPAFNAINTTNYIVFTNFKDSIPISRTDRRYAPFSVQGDTLDAALAPVTSDKNEYLNDLFDVVTAHGAELRKFFMDYEIPQWFFDMKQAPDTDFKDLMVNTEEVSSNEWIEDIRALIATGGEFFNKEVVCMAKLFEAYEDASNDMYQHTPNDSGQRVRILKALGYMSLGRQIRLKGEAHRFWAKKKMTNEDIRESLEIS